MYRFAPEPRIKEKRGGEAAVTSNVDLLVYRIGIRKLADIYLSIVTRDSLLRRTKDALSFHWLASGIRRISPQLEDSVFPSDNVMKYLSISSTFELYKGRTYWNIPEYLVVNKLGST